jgi:hypothetical protein
VIGRVKDLLGLRGDGAPARPTDRLIPTHEPFAPTAPTPDERDERQASTQTLPDSEANAARIEAGLAATVDKADLSPSAARPTAAESIKTTDLEADAPKPGSAVTAPKLSAGSTAQEADPPPAPFAPAEERGPWLADAFEQLFAEELGEPSAGPFGVPYRLSEADLDRVAARVVERLMRDPMSETVRRVVTEVSERLVREEIARIREAAAQSASDEPS